MLRAGPVLRQPTRYPRRPASVRPRAQVSVRGRVFSVVVKEFVIKSGRRSVTVRSAGTAQQALLDYLRALGCRDSEIVRLGDSTIAWRGARYSAAPVPERES